MTRSPLVAADDPVQAVARDPERVRRVGDVAVEVGEHPRDVALLHFADGQQAMGRIVERLAALDGKE